jgi:predicted PurR-regulated permease PerM
MAIKSSLKNINDQDVNEVLHLGKRILSIFYVVLIMCCVLGVFWFCKTFGVFSFIGTLLKVLSPLFIGFIIAWLFNPLIMKLRKKGLNKYLSVAIVYLVFIAFLVLFFKIFIPVMYSQINDFVKMIPEVLHKITDFVNDFFKNMSGNGIDFSSTRDAFLENLTKIGTNITAELPNTVVNTVIKLFSGLGTFAMGLIIGLYMSFDFDGITNAVVKIIPLKHQAETVDLMDNIGKEVRKSVNGTLLVACMVFICDTVGFGIIGLDGAFLFGLFCGITDLIPYIGPYIGAGVAGIIGFTQGPAIGIGVLIIALIVQLIENYVLQPVVMSQATQIHPIVIILGLLVFGHFFGIIGMILATPILSIAKVIIRFSKLKIRTYIKNKNKTIEVST